MSSRRRSLVFVSLLPAAIYLIYIASYFHRFGYPKPAVHDEFSYLLAADTFAHFRLANPTPPLWESFETIHVNMVPTYVSMYPPGQGLFLALGQVTLGHPWWGVVFSGLLLVIVAGWAFLAWLPERWALGANLVVLTVVLGTYWSESYWGGSVAAAGGALVLGSIGRIRKRTMARDWFTWAGGCVLLVYSRPYEGGVLVLLSVAELVRIYFAHQPEFEDKQREMVRGFLRGALPVTVAGVAFLGTYCTATTGKPYRLPYQENAAQYQIRRAFFWQQDRTPPVYRHEALRQTYVGLLRSDASARELYGNMARRIVGLYGGTLVFGVGALMMLVAFSTPFRWPVLCAAAGFAAVLPIPFINPHYYSPYTAFLAVGFAEGARRLASWSKLGQAARVALIALFCLMVGLQLYRRSTRVYYPQYPWVYERANIIRQLSEAGGTHLVLVRYDRTHNFLYEWVYNGAELSEEPILWARWWTADHNRSIAEHFRSRKVWVVDADRVPARLEPFDASPEGVGSN